jgi:PST family polysaccharide transporter
MVAIAAPGVAFAVVYSSVIVDLLLGPGWERAARVFQVLGFAALVLPLWNSLGWLFVSQDRMSEHLRFNAIDVCVKLAAVAVGLYWGPIGIAAAIVGRCYVMLPVQFWVIGRRGPVRVRDLYRILFLAITLAAVCMSTLVLARTVTGSLPPTLDLGCGLATTGVSALIGLSITPAGRHVLLSYPELRVLIARGNHQAAPPAE